MPVEEPWVGVPEFGWVPTLQTVLGGDPLDVDPARVANPRWVMLDGGFTGSWAPADARPWESWRPDGRNHAGWNNLTIYRAVTEPGGHHFQLQRARFTFYEPGGADFHLSPAEQSHRLVALSSDVIGGIRHNPVLDAATFTDAADMLDRVVTWARDSGVPTITALANEIDRTGSDFTGTAAEVFLWALDDLRLGLTDLITTVTEPTNWVTMLDGAATSIDRFKTALETAWTAFTQYRYHDPNLLVADVIDAITGQTDAAFAGTGFNGDAATPQAPWLFTLSGIDGLGTYDLSQPVGWDRLDADMKATWTARLADLEQAARAASRDLISSLGALWSSLGRGLGSPTHVPPPGPQTGPQNNGPQNDGPQTDRPQNIPDLSDVSTGPDSGPGDGSVTGLDGPDAVRVDALGTSGDGTGSAGGSGGQFGGGFGGPGTGGALGLAGFGGPAPIAVTGGSARTGGPDLAAGEFPGPLGFGGLVLPGLRSTSGDDDEDEDRRRRGFAGFSDGISEIGRADADDRDRAGSIVGPMGASPPGYTGPGDVEAALRREGLDVDGAGAEAGFRMGGGLTGVSFEGPAIDHPGGRDDDGVAVGSGLHAGFDPVADQLSPPLSPPMTGSLTGSNGRRDGRRDERTTWLSEDEKVWGADPDCAPAVVGGGGGSGVGGGVGTGSDPGAEDAGRFAPAVPAHLPTTDDLAPDLPAHASAQAHQ